MQQEWFELLYEQQYEHGIAAHGPASGNRVGLTPSFLVEAMRTPPGAGRDVTASHHPPADRKPYGGSSPRPLG